VALPRSGGHRIEGMWGSLIRRTSENASTTQIGKRRCLAPIRCGRDPGGRTEALVAIVALAKLGPYPFSPSALRPSLSLGRSLYFRP
jgi:hypothetical protein